jgi:cytochrome P450
MRTAPGLTHWIPLPYGVFKESLRDPLGFQVRARERFGDVFRYRMGPVLAHFLFHPDHVRHVLQDEYKNYPRGWHYDLLRRLLGNGLLVREGESWRRQRRLAQPAFHRQHLAEFARTMTDATAQMLTRWEQSAATGQVLDIGAEMSRLTLAIAGRTLFSVDVSAEADTVGRALNVLLPYLDHRFTHPLSLPVWVPTPHNLRFKQAVRVMDRVVYGIIEERRRGKSDHVDLLSLLEQARDEETGEGMTDQQLRDEVLTFFVAGLETTAIALTWTWYLLAGHPAVAQRLRDEVDHVLGGRAPTFEDAARLTYARQVVQESMRLYPPVYVVVRAAAKDDVIGGFHIPAGSSVALSAYVTQRHPDFWERPAAFDPDRFTPERVAARPKYAYFPFIGGPHQCIGNEFALLEMQIVLAMVMQNFRLEMLPGQTVKPHASLSLKPAGPIRMRLEVRSDREVAWPAAPAEQLNDDRDDPR